MSAKLMGRVWDLDLPNAQQSVLLALADHANHDGSDVYPSVGLVAWKTGYSHRQTQRIMAQLTEIGLLPIVREEGADHPREYRINLEAGVLKQPYENRRALERRAERAKKSGRQPGCQDVTTARGPAGVTSEPIRGDIPGPAGVTSEPIRGDTAMSPEPSRNRQGEPSRGTFPPVRPPQGGPPDSESGDLGKAAELWEQLVDELAPHVEARGGNVTVLRALEPVEHREDTLVIAGGAADFARGRYGRVLDASAARLGVVLKFRSTAATPRRRRRRAA